MSGGDSATHKLLMIRSVMCVQEKMYHHTGMMSAVCFVRRPQGAAEVCSQSLPERRHSC